MTNEEAYKKGFLDGLQTFAWWEDGVETVGTSGIALAKAVEQAPDLWNYLPPKEGE